MQPNKARADLWMDLGLVAFLIAFDVAARLLPHAPGIWPFAATALFVGGMGTVGYAIRRDLSFLYRILFWLLLALIVAGIVLIFVHLEAAYTAYALFGLVIFGLYTVVDFNRLRRAGTQEAIPLAAGIFLDVLNIFLFFLRLFSRRN